MSVKARLTYAVVALLVVATGVIGWAMVRSTRNSLIGQIDDRLVETRARQPLPPLPATPDPAAVGDTTDASTDDIRYRETAEIILSPRGSPVRVQPAGYLDDPEPLPALPPSRDPAFEELLGDPVTLPAVEGGLEYRVVAQRLPAGNARVLATSLATVDETTSDLLRAVLLTAGVVLALGALTSWLVIRRGLRPVDRMIETASAIAAGDLSQRVDHRDDRSELGRLAHALDDMLAQLETAFAEREESQARLRRFVGDASHELRTPVAAIRGYAELYRQGGIEPGEALERAMARIEGESERMGRLVEDLLLLARLDQQQPLEQADVDLLALARDAVSDLRATDPDRPVTLDAPETGPVTVTGDERRLRQILANLLANARVHTPEGTPVHVRVGRDGDEAVVAVADEGPGIAPADRARVFERFFRADPSRARSSGGAGLGLSIVAAVVDAHGGRVELESGPGEGATFTVRLPPAVPAPCAPGPAPEPGQPAHRSSS